MFHVEHPDGYHWFRLDEDGTTFIAYLENGGWYLPGIQGGLLTLPDSTYLRPVEQPPHH